LSVTAVGSAAVRRVAYTGMRNCWGYALSSACMPGVSFAACCAAFSAVIVNSGLSPGNGSM